MNQVRWHKVANIVLALVVLAVLIMLPSRVSGAPDTTTLNPNADSATIDLSTSDGGGTHYTLVSDSSDTTYVYTTGNKWETDLYDLSGSGKL